MAETQNKFTIGRAINGITINGLEYLLDESENIMLFNTSEEAVTFLQKNGFTEDEINEFIIEEDRRIKYTTDIGNEVNCTEEEFREEAKSMIEFAINDKEYAIDNIDAKMIAEDITGMVLGEHGLSDRALEIIEEQLMVYRGDSMLKLEEKTEKIVAFADNNKDKIHFEVPSDWLDKCFQELAEYEAFIDSNDNIESYVKYRKESLYDNLNDAYFGDMILMYAVEDNVIIGDKVLETSK